MRDSRLIELDGEERTVKELTVEQVETVMTELETGVYQGHILDALMDRDFPANALFMALDMEPKDFNLKVGPSELAALYDEVIAVNPSCAAMMVRLREAGTKRLESGNLLTS